MISLKFNYKILINILKQLISYKGILMENKDKYSMKNIIDLYNNGQIKEMIVLAEEYIKDHFLKILMLKMFLR